MRLYMYFDWWTLSTLATALLPDGPADANGGFQCAVLCSVLFNLAADQQGQEPQLLFRNSISFAHHMNSIKIY